MYRFPLNFFLFFNQFYIIELSNQSPPPHSEKKSETGADEYIETS